MALEVQCPGCGKSSQAPEGSAGKRARCKCGVEFRIPAEDAILASLWAVLDKPSGPEAAPGTAGQIPSIASTGVEPEGQSPRVGIRWPRLVSPWTNGPSEGSLLVISPEVVLPDRGHHCALKAVQGAGKRPGRLFPRVSDCAHRHWIFSGPLLRRAGVRVSYRMARQRFDSPQQLPRPRHHRQGQGRRRNAESTKRKVRTRRWNAGSLAGLACSCRGSRGGWRC